MRILNKAVNTMLSTSRQPDLNLNDVRARMYGEIVVHEYHFDRREKYIEIYEDMIKDKESIDKTKIDLLAHFKQVFQEYQHEESKDDCVFDHVKTFTLEMISKKHEEQSKKDFEENTKNFRIPRCAVKRVNYKTGPIDELKITEGKSFSLILIASNISDFITEEPKFYSDVLIERWIKRHKYYESLQNNVEMA